MNAPLSEDLVAIDESEIERLDAIGRMHVFPIAISMAGESELRCHGLTKRELFAAMVLPGLARAYVQGGDFMEGHIAEGAVKIADALLKELAK